MKRPPNCPIKRQILGVGPGLEYRRAGDGRAEHAAPKREQWVISNLGLAPLQDSHHCDCGREGQQYAACARAQGLRLPVAHRRRHFGTLCECTSLAITFELQVTELVDPQISKTAFERTLLMEERTRMIRNMNDRKHNRPISVRTANRRIALIRTEMACVALDRIIVRDPGPHWAEWSLTALANVVRDHIVSVAMGRRGRGPHCMRGPGPHWPAWSRTALSRVVTAALHAWSRTKLASVVSDRIGSRGP